MENPKHIKNFTIKKLIEMNYDAHEKFNTNSQIKFETTMLKPSVCGYSVA